MAMIDGGGRATEHEQHCRMYEVRLQVNRIHICVVMIYVLFTLSIEGVVEDIQRIQLVELRSMNSIAGCTRCAFTGESDAFTRFYDL